MLYLCFLQQQGFVRHTVNKVTFSEQCYYVFGDFKKAAANTLSQGMEEQLFTLNGCVHVIRLTTSII